MKHHLVLAWLAFYFCCTTSLVTVSAELPPGAIALADLDLSRMTSGWGNPQANLGVVGKPLSIAGRNFAYGVGTHADSVMALKLDGRTESFTAQVGVDGSAGKKGSVRFLVFGNGKEMFNSGEMKGGQKAKPVEVKLSGVTNLLLRVDDCGDGINTDHADWAEAYFIAKGAKPEVLVAPEPQTSRRLPAEEPYYLTPAPTSTPKINGPKVYGVRPGHPFLYRIPCTGDRPMQFGAANLPPTLKLESESGIIRGTAPGKSGEILITFTARNRHGEATRSLKLCVGNQLALTPPMGWNHWYTWYNRITDAHFRAAADAMVGSGMADYGYSYVNIDDCWMRRHPSNLVAGIKFPAGLETNLIFMETRDPGGRILPNGYFPDMKGLTDYIHGKGLRAGIYTSPGPMTCGKYEGAFQHEQQDAQTFAEWGFDFLKYDWCSYGKAVPGQGLERAQKPYRLMGDILQKLDRDFIFNLCQYGMDEVWKWGAEMGGHSWRTTGDLGLQKADRLPGFYQIGFKNAEHWEYAKPGAWNDPDYLIIGAHETQRTKGLTPSEQYSYMSMWCLMAAPLFFSGDMTQLDKFTLNVLCNAEVIEIDQDPLGKQGRILRKSATEFVMSKPLEDGSLAVGLFNTDESEREINVSWSELGVKGAQRVRDLWQQVDQGAATGRISAKVRPHGVMLVRLWPQDR